MWVCGYTQQNDEIPASMCFVSAREAMKPRNHHLLFQLVCNARAARMICDTRRPSSNLLPSRMRDSMFSCVLVVLCLYVKQFVFLLWEVFFTLCFLIANIMDAYCSHVHYPSGLDTLPKLVRGTEKEGWLDLLVSRRTRVSIAHACSS